MNEEPNPQEAVIEGFYDYRKDTENGAKNARIGMIRLCNPESHNWRSFRKTELCSLKLHNYKKVSPVMTLFKYKEMRV